MRLSIRCFLCILILPLLSCSVSSNVVQADSESPHYSDFEFVLMTSDEGVSLTCNKGCLWDKLSFNLTTNYRPLAINREGMYSLHEQSLQELSDYSGFVVTITRLDKGISLSGNNGSAWKSLSFSCPDGGCHQTINQFGMN